MLTNSEVNQLLEGLDALMEQVESGTFSISDDFEDVHSKIEFELTQKYGDVGKKIHTARSRNDQVLVAMQLYLKDEITAIKQSSKELFDLYLSLAEKHQNDMLPGYTHLQIAMPSSFGLWFSAYAETLADDLLLLNAAHKCVIKTPWGVRLAMGVHFLLTVMTQPIHWGSKQ